MATNSPGSAAFDAANAAPAKAAPVKAAKAPKKKAAAPQRPPAAPSVLASGVSTQDWQTVQQVASQYNIDPYLLVAIGIHETGWGTQGAGRQGFTLGVGVPDSGTEQAQYQGLSNQLVGAAQILANYNVHTAADLATGVLAPHDGQVRYASDPSWTSGVLNAYNQVKGTKFTAQTSTAADPTASTATTPPGTLGTPKPQTPQDYLDNADIAAQYGYLSAYLNDKEIGPILRQAAAGGWGSNKLLAALEKTHWWKSTSQTSRQLQALQREDPASYREQLGRVYQHVTNLAVQAGVKIDPQRLSQLATTAMWSSWSEEQLQSAVGAEFKYANGKAYTGTAGADVQKFKSLAAQYLVPLAPQTLGAWTKQALQGKINPDDFTGYLAQQAKTLFPWMGKSIDSGVSPTQYLDPYRQAAASTLELDPASVNLMDPKWMKLFQTVDPKTGDRTERGLAQAMTMIRTDPTYGYDQTQQAKNEAAAFAANISQAFGYSSGGSTLSSGVPTFNG